MVFPPQITRYDPNRRPSGVVIVCEHASNHFPDAFGTLGLDEAARQSHAAWDPGALGVAQAMAHHLNADLVAATVSRLVYDSNRPPDVPSAMPERSERYEIPGNQGLTADQKAARVAGVYDPFRHALGALMDERATGALVTVHSFNPVFQGQRRACEIGILNDDDTRLADAMLSSWPEDAPWRAERNVPYGPQDGVTHTLRAQGIARGWPNVMLEIRNDLIATEAAQHEMGRLMSRVVTRALTALNGDPDA